MPWQSEEKFRWPMKIDRNGMVVRKNGKGIKVGKAVKNKEKEEQKRK